MKVVNFDPRKIDVIERAAHEAYYTIKPKPPEVLLVNTQDWQIIKDEIIRVTAVKGNDFSSRKSLMVNKEKWGKTKWSLKEFPNELIISTKKIDVKIDKSTGTIKYYDKKRNEITSEK
ncbi:MAG: DUF4968 domain-containing protein, partial [Bacteroidota bacterium]|nr:DUF4968 domain-containing protein [Bacteroidota bacterium]